MSNGDTIIPSIQTAPPNPAPPTTTNTTNTNPVVVPGPRASRLQQVFHQALARTIRANSWTNFSGCFPTPAKHAPASLEHVWRQLNAKLEESAKAEFEDILEERQAVGNLNELDRLVGEARRRMEREEQHGDGDGDGRGRVNVVPHTLGAEELYKAHLMPYLQEAQASLDAKLSAVQTQNAEMATTIQDQRKEIDALLSGLESILADLDGAAVAATQYGKENGLRQDAIRMDEEVRATRQS